MATRKKSSAKRQTKKERMAQIERQQAFKKEIFLWIVVAVSILLFISNFGIGGHLGNAVSGFLLACLEWWHIFFRLCFWWAAFLLCPIRAIHMLS